MAKDGRPKKTQEELDAEMEDYWGAKENGNGAEGVATAAQDDVDMIE
jgi:THO complex subunit 4